MLSFLGRYSYKVHQGDLITVPAKKILHNLQTSVKGSTQNPLHQVVWRMNSTAEDKDSYSFDSRLDFRRLPGPVLILPEESSFGGMSAGSFSRTAAGYWAYFDS